MNHKQEYVLRRQQLMRTMEANSIAIIPSSQEVVRSRDTNYPFRQDSDFYYLTGFNEPNAILVLIPKREHGEVVLFCNEKNPEKETWHGRRQGTEGAKENYNMEDAFPIEDIDDILPGLIEGRARIYYELGKNRDFDNQVMQWVNTIRDQVKKGACPPGEFVDLRHALHDMRLFKSSYEIKLMKKACQIAADAHSHVMQVCEPGLTELDIESEFHHHCSRAGARFQAYSSIVASGNNACILHYVDNEDKLKSGDLLLIDAGAEYQGYASDITRTYPINGVFTSAQKQVYDIVLKAQLEAIEQAKPGNHWMQPHNAAVAVITQGLVDLGILKGDVETLIEDEAYKPYYMHKTGHWIGLDVHDVGDYQIDNEPRILEAGMVMTIEPGIYIDKDSEGIDEQYLGIGIRIEDDILVTPSGNEVLTAAVPKERAEIEALMSRSHE